MFCEQIDTDVLHDFRTKHGRVPEIVDEHNGTYKVANWIPTRFVIVPKNWQNC